MKTIEKIHEFSPQNGRNCTQTGQKMMAFRRENLGIFSTKRAKNRTDAEETEPMPTPDSSGYPTPPI